MSFDPSNIDVEDFLECLEIRNARMATAEEIRFSCPFVGHANGDENASAYMNIETTAFFCHGCKEKGNAVSFTATYLDISPIEATRILRERYQPGYLNPDARSTLDEIHKIINGKKLDEEKPVPILPEDATQRFEVDWFEVEKALNRGDEVPPEFTYMLNRGFGPETLSEWQFGYDEHTDRITFPVRDLLGRLIGFKGRAWDDRHPKYLVIGDRSGKPEHYGWPTYPTGKVIFGLVNAVKMEDPNHEDKPRHLIVCEGELNAIALQMHGWAGVAVNGSNFSDTQAHLLRQEADLVTTFFDSDQAGDDGTKLVVDALSPYLPVRIVPDHEGDPADMDAGQIAELVKAGIGSTLARIT